MGIGVYSMYQLTDAVQILDRRGRALCPAFIDLRQRMTESDSSDFLVYVNSRMETWGRIGLQFLSDANYWWVIADLSDVIDPFEELEVDAVLRSPTSSRFLFDILPGDS